MRIIDIIVAIANAKYDNAEDLVSRIFSSLDLTYDQTNELLQIATKLRTKNLSAKYPEYTTEIDCFAETLGMLHKMISRFENSGVRYPSTFMIEKLSAATLPELRDELTDLMDMYSVETMCIWKQINACRMPKTLYPLIEFSENSCVQSVGIMHGKENSRAYASEGYGYTTSRLNYVKLTGKKRLQLKPSQVYPLVVSTKSKLYKPEYEKPGAVLTDRYANVKIPISVMED